ncbi:MAG: Ig-like domain-containing protein, partial [Clostridiales bacterium]|nr:Ig-like domain-containing protein [Clostridiales bacterium]
MNKKGKILALALTLALSGTSALMVGCSETPKESTGTTSSITLDKENLSLDAGRSEQLSASSAEVTWKTSDPSVATVDENGNVT